MPNYMRTMETALRLFRNHNGIAANPEDLPESWRHCLWEAEQYLEEEANGNE